MAKRRDAYKSGFDGIVPGARSAVHDLSMALYFLQEFAEERGLLNERVSLYSGKQSWTIGDILTIARAALDTSISDAVEVYLRLNENASAVDAMLQDTHERQWVSAAHALRRTVENQAVVKRSAATKARRRVQRAANRRAESE